MKNVIKSGMAILLISAFASCNNKSKDPAVADFQQYVDSVTSIDKDYTESNWAAINTGYEMRSEKADKAELAEEDKKAVADSKQKYADYKAKYEKEVVKNKPPELTWKQKLRNNLFGEGRIGDDMSFSWVTADNIYTTYKNFVDVVQANRKEYSREDWDEVKLLYEALDTRKNAVEKDLKTADNLNIAKQKVKFSAIYTTQRPMSKLRENEKAKE